MNYRTVLDLSLLQWLSRAQVNYPSIFDEMKSPNGTFNSKDITMMFVRTSQRNIGHCLQDIISIGFIDTKSIGCVASEVVLYLSLVFIIGVVAIRFVMALMFQWFFSWRLGNFPRETYQQRMERSAEIENWSSDIYRPRTKRVPAERREERVGEWQAGEEQDIPSKAISVHAKACHDVRPPPGVVPQLEAWDNVLELRENRPRRCEGRAPGFAQLSAIEEHDVSWGESVSVPVAWCRAATSPGL